MVGAAKMRALARFVTKKLPKGWGFCLIVFPFDKPGIANYISNAQRATMIQALKDKVRVLEAKDDFQTPEEN